MSSPAIERPADMNEAGAIIERSPDGSVHLYMGPVNSNYLKGYVEEIERGYKEAGTYYICKIERVLVAPPYDPQKV